MQIINQIALKVDYSIIYYCLWSRICRLDMGRISKAQIGSCSKLLCHSKGQPQAVLCCCSWKGAHLMKTLKCPINTYLYAYRCCMNHRIKLSLWHFSNRLLINDSPTLVIFFCDVRMESFSCSPWCTDSWKLETK